MNPNVKLTECFSIIPAFAPAVPASAAVKYISLKNALRVTVKIKTKNATTVTGSAVTLAQARDVSGTGAKTLAFAKVSKAIDTAVSELLTDEAVVSNTFTPDNTDSKNGIYVIDVLPEHLDINNGFDCLGVGLANGTAQTVDVEYIVLRKQGGSPTTFLAD